MTTPSDTVANIDRAWAGVEKSLHVLSRLDRAGLLTLSQPDEGGDDAMNVDSIRAHCRSEKPFIASTPSMSCSNSSNINVNQP